MSDFEPKFWEGKRIVALSGGIGGARLVHGLYKLLPADSLDVVINTGDDFEHLSVFVSPDCDTVMYTLADLAPVDRGWGMNGDTDLAMRMVESLGEPVWFNLGDRDLGTNLLRTARLRAGQTLTQVTRDFRKALGLQCELLPMADSPHPTTIHTQDGRALSFQSWLVGERGAPAVARVELGGNLEPTPDVVEAIQRADIIIIPPSNPWVSVEPILNLRGIRELVRTKPVIAISPIIQGAAIKGPLADMIRSMDGVEASAEAVAKKYADILDIWFVSSGDASADAQAFETIECDVLMTGVEGRVRLAKDVLAAGQRLLS